MDALLAEEHFVESKCAKIVYSEDFGGLMAENASKIQRVFDVPEDAERYGD